MVLPNPGALRVGITANGAPLVGEIIYSTFSFFHTCISTEADTQRPVDTLFDPPLPILLSNRSMKIKTGNISAV